MDSSQIPQIQEEGQFFKPSHPFRPFTLPILPTFEGSNGRGVLFDVFRAARGCLELCRT